MHDNGGSTGARTRRRRLPRRILTTGIAALLATTGALAVTGQPASALLTFVQPTEVAWTDNAQPTRSFPAEDGAVPVGTWQDSTGAKHTSRAYFTFDLTRYHGQRIISARAVTGERSVNNCDKPRELELWRTDNPATAPSWKTAPQAHEKLADLSLPEAGCPWSYLSKLITDAVSTAVAERQDKLTLMLRVGEHEDVVHWGRRVKTVGISIEHNRPPDVPTKLNISGVTCTDETFIGTTRPTLQAWLTDPNVNETGGGDQVKATFAWWPVDRPSERTEYTYPYTMYSGTWFRYEVPDGLMAHGGHYAVAVRATDQYGDTSDWSTGCRFTIDTRVPPAPTVTSTDYPEGRNGPGHGGPGIPGTFHFTAPGADDVTGYYYGEYGPTTYVAADDSGAATISYAPTSSHYNRLYVQAADRTRNRSTQTTYEFMVRDTAPRITDGNPNGAFGEPRELTYTPGMENVATYTWRLNDGEPATVPAGADGTATVTITPRRSGPNTVTVTSRTSDGLPSGEGRLYFWLATQPTVASEDFLSGGEPPLAGTSGTFVFTSGMPGVTEYVWSVAGGPEQTVQADADGRATVTYTPTFGGFHWLEVYGRTADGEVSETASAYFDVTSWAPTIESADYPIYQESGGPGVVGQFAFRPAREGVTGYVYTFEGEDERTVTADAEGVATISWTPQSYPADRSGWVRLTVRAKMGSIVSDETEHVFILSRLAPTVTSSDYPPTGGGGPGVPGQFTLTAQMPGTTEFIYTYNGEEHTVAAGADGTATITLTPAYDGGHYLFVSSRTATGITSGEDYHYFYVNYQG